MSIKDSKIIIQITEKIDIVSVVQKALVKHDIRYKTIQPSEQQVMQSTLEGTLLSQIDTIRNIAG